jgi:peptidoglycan/LPS O-acetylase OafA/YrhL
MMATSVTVTSPTSTPTSEHYYRPELDALRFFAFLSVFLFHGLPGIAIPKHYGWSWPTVWLAANLKNAGRFGVCLFFVLSSFLITELLMRERSSTGTVHVPAFYVRRILRIWPLYFFFLFFGVLLGHFVSGWQVETQRLIAFLVLLGNWYVANFGSTANPIGPLWSISIEEQFYLTWPWIAKAAGRTAILVVSILLLPLSWITIYLLARSAPEASRVMWFSSLVQFQFFALGALAALLLKGRAPKWKMASRLVLFTVAGALWTSAQGFFLRDYAPFSGPLFYILGYCLVGIGCVLLLLGFLEIPQRYIPRPLIQLGKVSYGLYVFHRLSQHIASYLLLAAARSELWTGRLRIVLRDSATLVVALLLTMVLAFFSYRFLEMPFLRLKERFTFIRSRAV